MLSEMLELQQQQMQQTQQEMQQLWQEQLVWQEQEEQWQLKQQQSHQDDLNNQEETSSASQHSEQPPTHRSSCPNAIQSLDDPESNEERNRSLKRFSSLDHGRTYVSQLNSPLHSSQTFDARSRAPRLPQHARKCKWYSRTRLSQCNTSADSPPQEPSQVHPNDNTYLSVVSNTLMMSQSHPGSLSHSTAAPEVPPASQTPELDSFESDLQAALQQLPPLQASPLKPSPPLQQKATALLGADQVSACSFGGAACVLCVHGCEEKRLYLLVSCRIAPCEQGVSLSATAIVCRRCWHSHNHSSLNSATSGTSANGSHR